MAGYPDLFSFTSLITGPLASSSFGFVDALNTTSTSSPLTVFAPVNSAFSRFEDNTAVSTLVFATIDNKTLLEIAVANHILPNISANSTVLSQIIASSNNSRHLRVDITYGTLPLLTLAGLNITVHGLVQNGTGSPITPLIFAQNALVIQANAIVAANGVVHLISNIIDPFVDAAGGFYGPSVEVIEGAETEFGPLVSLAIAMLNIF